MNVILLERITNLGDLGDEVVVKSGFARNFLIPKGKAVRASKENRDVFEARRAELERVAQERLGGAQARATKLEGLALRSPRKPVMKASCMVRLVRTTFPKRWPRRAQKSRRARSGCRRVSFAWLANTTSTCICTPMSASRSRSSSSPNKSRRALTASMCLRGCSALIELAPHVGFSRYRCR